MVKILLARALHYSETKMDQVAVAGQAANLETSVVGKSARLGDISARDIPRLLTKDEIRGLSEIDSGKFVLAALLEIGLMAAAVVISETWFNPFTYLFAIIVIGTRINGLGGLMHDAAHYRAFRNRTINDIAGEIAAFPTTASMAGYRNSHFSHHRELNSHKDPDWVRSLLLEDYEFPAPQIIFLRRLLLHVSGIRAPGSVIGFHKNAETRDIPVLTARLRIAVLLGLVVSSIALGFWPQLLLYWAVPILTVFLGLRYFRIVAEHFAVGHDGVLSESRTVVAPAWQLFWLAPWGLNYHLEHHLFPGITCFNLGKAHRILMTRTPFAEQAHITRGYGGLLREVASAAPGERDKARAALAGT
jgi:fatty acid desaturase